MLRKAVILAILYLICGGVAPRCFGQNTADILAGAKKAVVTVIILDVNGKQIAGGSGFIARADGVVVTAWHVIAGASSARIKLSNGKVLDVQGVFSIDREKDYSLIKVAATGLPTLALGDSEKMRQGDRVLTLGTPLGLELTASEGIVSAFRTLPTSGKLMQITAPISPGNSGGPVMNERGQVIGVALYKIKDGEALNFAVVINEIKAKLLLAQAALPFRQAVQGKYAGSPEEAFFKGIASMPREKHGADAGEKCEVALSWFRKAIQRRPSYFDAHYMLGCLYLFELNRYQEASDELQEAARLKPEDHSPHFMLGAAYLKLHRIQEAIDETKAAIRLKPDIAGAHKTLGAMYALAERHQMAVAEYQEAVQVEPHDSGLHYLLGCSYSRMKRFKEAMDELREAIRLKPDFAGAHGELGWICVQLRRDQEAVIECKETIRLTPDDAMAHLNLGAAYGHLARYQEAVDEAKMSIRLNPGSHEAHLLLGTSYGLMNLFQPANDEFKEAIRLKPDFADAHFGLGSTFLIQGDRGKAIDEYRILKGLDETMADMLFKAIYP